MNIKLIATAATLVGGAVLTMFAKKGVEAKVSEKETEASIHTTGEEVKVDIFDDDADEAKEEDEPEKEVTTED